MAGNKLSIHSNAVWQAILRINPGMVFGLVMGLLRRRPWGCAY